MSSLNWVFNHRCICLSWRMAHLLLPSSSIDNHQVHSSFRHLLKFCTRSSQIITAFEFLVGCVMHLLFKLPVISFLQGPLLQSLLGIQRAIKDINFLISHQEHFHFKGCQVSWNNVSLSRPNFYWTFDGFISCLKSFPDHEKSATPPPTTCMSSCLLFTCSTYCIC